MLSQSHRLMCRLFGFRSVISSSAHKSLLEAENCLSKQSSFHSDGWGLAYYVEGAPQIIKSTEAAMEDDLFKKVGGVLSSETVVAHLRKATQGKLCTSNAHPFQYGKWIFAHNGNVKNWQEHGGKIAENVSPHLRQRILGSTDSETFFYLILSRLSTRARLDRPGASLEDVVASAKEAMSIITGIVGPMLDDDKGAPTETYLSFILTDGSTMVAHNGGKTLYHSTHKTSCSDRDTCPCFSAECESHTTSGYTNHLLFSSEKMGGENVWEQLPFNSMVGVDWTMRLKYFGPDGLEYQRQPPTPAAQADPAPSKVANSKTAISEGVAEQSLRAATARPHRQQLQGGELQMA